MRDCPSFPKLRPRRPCSLIYSPRFFSDLIVEGFRVQKNILEQAFFMTGGGLTKLILLALNLIGSLLYFHENTVW